MGTRFKTRIVLLLIHEVVADVDGTASEIVLFVHREGALNELRLPIRWRGERNSTSAVIIQAMRKTRVAV
ncbi:hypothetical protein [Bradyrhizobium arachidis]|uniref:hypothetical protein n=1 Tax=Bradyrhizobium arachidis TaxID=858423 RepID=UPI002162508C|nr:hypothetical protein [Bradyrhizobium arachidis]UVO30354.1 hypothetical protein KUF59_06350 [Bradyrhizobium arachidis]